MKTIRIRPRKGVVLAGIPAAGADVPEALAQEWIQAKLVNRVETAAPRRSAGRPATEG